MVSSREHTDSNSEHFKTSKTATCHTNLQQKHKESALRLTISLTELTRGTSRSINILIRWTTPYVFHLQRLKQSTLLTLESPQIFVYVKAQQTLGSIQLTWGSHIQGTLYPTTYTDAGLYFARLQTDRGLIRSAASINYPTFLSKITSSSQKYFYACAQVHDTTQINCMGNPCHETVAWIFYHLLT